VSIKLSFKNTPQGKVALGKFHGKGTLNLVDDKVLSDAERTIDELSSEGGVRCLILEGRNETSFIGGADLKLLRNLTPSSSSTFIRAIHSFCDAIRGADFPVIAKLRGYCLGAGMEIAAACDIRIGDESVKCGMPEVRVGVPSVVEAALLPGLLGSGKAKEIILRGNICGSEEALSIGFLQRMTEASSLDGLVDVIEADILRGGAKAIALQKELFTEWDSLSVNDGIEKGVEIFSRSYQSDEPKVMIDQFFESKS
tara:strand:- start:48 stop:812 length:765 start_codon:yes stop_codon:yes gene_type:complete